jgi:hypothetical protein
MLKRAGRCHAVSGADGTARGELAMECPACPHPGKNLPENWREAGPEHSYVFLTVDGDRTLNYPFQLSVHTLSCHRCKFSVEKSCGIQ